MARHYLDVESLDGAVVRCEVLEWRAGWAAGSPDWQSTRVGLYALVLRPDTGDIVLVFDFGVATISISDPYEKAHERDWPALAEHLERHTNRSK